MTMQLVNLRDVNKILCFRQDKPLKVSPKFEKFCL